MMGTLLASGICVWLGGLAAARRAPALWLGSILLGAACFLTASITVLSGGHDWEWTGAFLMGGERVHVRLDALSAFFLVLLCVVGPAAAVYGREYWPDRTHPRSAWRGRLWWSIIMVSLAVILLSQNGLHFLIGWELFTLSAYFLITLDRRRDDVRYTGWFYLGASHVAVLALFAFFAFLAARNGNWDLGPMKDRPEFAPLFWLVLFGFGLKAGVFPLHVWLPSAHASAPTHVSAMLSGVTIKIGIYGLVRFTGWMPVPPAAGWVVVVLGVASAVLGVAFALGQHDLKRLLAYHSVENIGIILIGLGFGMVGSNAGNAPWGRLALAGGLLHVWNHGLFKALLFLGAGSVLHATGTRTMSLLGGLWRSMPWTAALFALGAAAISGLPPLNGFVSEWLVYLGLFDASVAHGQASWGAIPAAILLGITGALALACFTKVCGVVFLGAPRSPLAERAHECGKPMRGAMIVLAAACAAIGLGPCLFWPAVARAAGNWNPAWNQTDLPAPLGTLGTINIVIAALGIVAGAWLWRKVARRGLRRALTWDCGYAAPSPRMQYTAGSFAATITEWFAWILHPRKHDHRSEEILSGPSHVSQHTPEIVLESVVEPVANRIMRLSTSVRRFQHGRVQSYLLYLVLGLAALAAIVLVK